MALKFNIEERIVGGITNWSNDDHGIYCLLNIKKIKNIGTPSQIGF